MTSGSSFFKPKYVPRFQPETGEVVNIDPSLTRYEQERIARHVYKEWLLSESVVAQSLTTIPTTARLTE